MGLGFLGFAKDSDILLPSLSTGLHFHTHAASLEKDSDLELPAHKTEIDCIQCVLHPGTKGQKDHPPPDFHFRRHGEYHAHPRQRSLPWYTLAFPSLVQNISSARFREPPDEDCLHQIQ